MINQYIYSILSIYRHLATTRHLKNLNIELISAPEHTANENKGEGC